MKMIQCISEMIETNISEAREKILKAYELRGEDMDAAMWLREMSAAHLTFNDKGHGIVTKLINQYKMSDDYKRDPSYSDGMTDAWNAIHNMHIRESAEIRAMIEAFK